MPQSNTQAQWYIVHVLSGSEGRVADAIREQAEKKNLTEMIEDILVPTETVVEIKKGEKKSVERKVFPGYLLIKMYMNDVSWHLIKGIPKVTGFLGNKSGPSPVVQSEVDRIVNHIKDAAGKSRVTVEFEIGEKVRVCDGPFTSFSGLVEEVDEDKSRLKVSVLIFGRPTPVELEFTQVEKV